MPRIHDSIKNPRQILGSAPGALHRVLDHARQLLDVQARIREIIPGDIFVAACDDQCLHLITPSSALATRVKYNQRKLLAAFGHHGRSITRIKVSVRPEYRRPDKAAPRSAKTISPENARHLTSVAKYIEDEALRKALLDLSKRALTHNLPQ